MSKSQVDPRNPVPQPFEAAGDVPPSGGGSDPIPTGTDVPIPDGVSFEQPGGGGQDEEERRTTTSMPLKGR